VLPVSCYVEQVFDSVSYLTLTNRGWGVLLLVQLFVVYLVHSLQEDSVPNDSIQVNLAEFLDGAEPRDLCIYNKVEHVHAFERLRLCSAFHGEKRLTYRKVYCK